MFVVTLRAEFKTLEDAQDFQTALEPVVNSEGASLHGASVELQEWTLSTSTEEED